jgi:hypothetical protein
VHVVGGRRGATVLQARLGNIQHIAVGRGHILMISRIVIGAGILTALSCLGCVAANAASDNVSVYGKYDDSQCEDIPEPPAKFQGDHVQRCKTTAGIDVVLREEKERSSHSYGPNYYVGYGPSGIRQIALTQTVEFSESVNGVVEFRMKKGAKQPFAAIQRVFTKLYEPHREDEISEGQVLVVTKIEGDEACHMAYIDVGGQPNANEIARNAADSMAESFKCGRDNWQRVSQ